METLQAGFFTKNVASDIMDLSIRKTLLEIYAYLYFTWTYRNRGFTHLQSDFQGFGRYYYRSSNWKISEHLYCNDQLFHHQHSDFSGFQLRIYLH